MRILITGNEGLIGTHLTNFLRKEHEVHGVDLKSGRNVIKLNAEKYFDNNNFDLLIHLAAMCKIRDLISNPITAHENNATADFNAFEFARRNNIKKVVYFSSSRVLSKEKNPYTTSKIYGEELAKTYNNCYGIDYKILRPTTVYGEKDTLDRAVPLFVNLALQNKPITIFGDKNKTLDITYITDFIESFDLIMKEGEWNTDYNICNGVPIKLVDLVKFIIDETCSKSEIIFKPAEIAQPQEDKVDIIKIKELGYVPKSNWKQGVRNTINWIKSIT